MDEVGMSCPKCSGVIAEPDVNVKEGVALCRACDKLWKLRELATDPEEAESDRAAEGEMPAGCWLRDLGVETVMGATCRGPTGCFFLFFTLFWNGIVSIFLSIAVAGLYTNLIGPLPAWFPMSGTNVSVGSSKATVGTMPMGMSIAIALFMVPFVLVGIGTAIAAVMGLLGRVEVRLRGQEGEVFTGVGPVGWRRRFAADAVRSVRVTDSGSSTNNKPNKHIVIESDRTVKVGVMLSDARRRWLAGVLRRVLAPR